jgi:hypothetical protein
MRVERSFAAGPQRRRASLTIEILLLLPIVLLVIWAMVEISMMIATNERLNEASIQGCRVASRGGNREEIEHAVREVLGHGRLSRAHIEAHCEDEHGRPLASGETVCVVVSIPAREAVIGPLCFSGTHHLVGRTVMRKE